MRCPHMHRATLELAKGILLSRFEVQSRTQDSRTAASACTMCCDGPQLVTTGDCSAHQAHSAAGDIMLDANTFWISSHIYKTPTHWKACLRSECMQHCGSMSRLHASQSMPSSLLSCTGIEGDLAVRRCLQGPSATAKAAAVPCIGI